jgi:hypothetical protein
MKIVNVSRHWTKNLPERDDCCELHLNEAALRMMDVDGAECLHIEVHDIHDERQGVFAACI